MRPHDNHEDRGTRRHGQTRARSGVAPRCAGEAAARERAAAHRGFTPALPHAGAARRALEEGGRQLGLRPGPVRTLSALLGLYRGWGLRRPPVLAATNAAIARAAGCDERTVQKHLALLRARGLGLVEYGPHNRRRPEPEAAPGDPAGIDLRPALVAAAELGALLDQLERERRAAVAGLRLAQRALLLARAALAARTEPDGPTPEMLQVLEGHRRALRRARRRLNHPAAPPPEPATPPARPRPRRGRPAAPTSGRGGPRSRRSRPSPQRWRKPWRRRWARPRIRHPGTSFRASIRPNQTPLRRRTDSGRPGRSARRRPTAPISPWTSSRTARSRPASGRTGSASPLVV